ncbi:MAG: hypothetical protein RL538_327 [Candidatus Parcubacteria bacterium]|jgi:energy-coupling factor transporter ATP-binding protein EcfA2
MTMFDPEKITYFAKTDARGALVPFGIKAKDRQRHMYVIGKTGMGKSTLLENLAAQDIMNGEGMAFIDPHGSAAETLLEYIPEHRVNDVVYFAPFDLDYPVSFNVMEDVGEDKRHLVVSGLMSTFKKIWVDAWSARMEYILTNSLLALIEYPDTTLLSVNRMLSNKAYRQQVVDYCKDPAVKSFWNDEFANYTERMAAEAVPAIQNKIGQFTGNPLIRNIIGQPNSSFDIRKMMDEKKILIMNLSKGLIGETNANLLGSMLTTRIYLAAMSRADLHPSVMKTMPNFYFYVDEFQSFANSTFANILSEARKYHLNLIIAHQYVDQMEEDVRSAVFGNVGTTVAFRVGPFDAEVLETVFAPQFTAIDLVNLGFAQIYLSLMIDGIGSSPFSAVTMPHWPEPPVSYRGMVIEQSRKLYAKPRPEVEKLIVELHAPAPKKEGDEKRPIKKPSNNGGGGGSYGNTGSAQSSQRTQRPPVRSAEGDSRRPPQKPVAPAKQPEDLRAILSKISQAQGVPQAKPEVKEPTPARSDLRSALSSVLQTQTPVQQAPSQAPTPEPAIKKEEKAPIPPETKPERATPVERSTPRPQNVTPERRATPQFGPNADLDPAVIKRMLREERQDRSPFS